MDESQIDSGILQWIDKNGIVNSKGDKFEWAAHGFLIQPMSDWSKRIAIRKSAQVGFSESFGVLKSIYAAIHYNWNVIYTLPSDRMSWDFVTTKIDPILASNPGLGDVVKGTTAIKKINNRFLYFLGTHSTQGKGKEAQTDKGISYSADLLIHDELDRSDQHTVEQYGSRTEDSDFAGMWAFSNSTYPGVGCDGLYEDSDQKVWMVKCSHCNHYQYLDWYKVGEVSSRDTSLIDPKNEMLVCSKCKKELTDSDRLQGEWVARKNNKNISGYWMSQLNYVKHSIPDLLYKERHSSKQHFYNFILGKPYRGTDEVVDRKSILKNLRPGGNEGGGFVAMGVDQGVWKHVVMGNEKGIFKVFKTKDWDEVERVFNKYNAIMVVDALPYNNVPKEWVKKYPGRVFMCYYSRDKDDAEILRWLRKKNRGVVRVQRTKYFDILVEKFSAGEKPISLNDRQIEEFIAHWETLSRQEVEDSMGILRGEWASSNGQDHYAHATLYQDVAMSRLTDRGGSVINNRKGSGGIQRGIYVGPDSTVPAYSIEKAVKNATKKKIDWKYT